MTYRDERGVIIKSLNLKVNDSVFIPAGTPYSGIDLHYYTQKEVEEGFFADIHTIYTRWDGLVNRLTHIGYYDDETTVRHIDITDEFLKVNNYDERKPCEDF